MTEGIFESHLKSREEMDRDARRKVHELAYALQYDFNPEVLDLCAKHIDCGGDCDTVWREHDTNASGCSKSDSEDGCPFELACQLREMATAVRQRAWLLAFADGAWNG